MAERQGKLGDAWNMCAVKFLSLLGWSYIGDKDIDVIGEDGNPYGVDALMNYRCPGMPHCNLLLLNRRDIAKTASTIRFY